MIRLSVLLVAWFVFFAAPASAERPNPFPGPNACQGPGGSTPCRDTDGDGLCDSWEHARRLPSGAPLPDADPNRPDIYLRYDYMGWATPGAACSLDSDCPTNDVCHEGRCNHNHKPDPRSLQLVVDAFARHGIALHIHPGAHEVQHSEVITWSRPDDGTSGATAVCAGADIVAGELGGFAVSFFDIKDRFFERELASAYHYAVFSHFVTCLTDVDAPAGSCYQCPADDRGVLGGQPKAGSAGSAENPGNDFIVALGDRYFSSRLRAIPLTEAGVLMHELGHNLGLHHKGDTALPDLAPNYLSVMNIRYIFSGIQEAEPEGPVRAKTCAMDSDCSPQNQCFFSNPPGPTGTCRRIDYSDYKLNTLVERHLDEASGVSPLGSGQMDLIRFFTWSGRNGAGRSSGPVDWDGLPEVSCSVDADCTGGGSLSGRCLPQRNACEVQADLNLSFGISEVMPGFVDWDHGSCRTSADCEVNLLRQDYHDLYDSSVDGHAPCVQGRCRSMWGFPFGCFPWGKD